MAFNFVQNTLVSANLGTFLREVGKLTELFFTMNEESLIVVVKGEDSELKPGFMVVHGQYMNLRVHGTAETIHFHFHSSIAWIFKTFNLNIKI
jgi:hypothetical protein